jgi:hypothetical protein
MPEKSQKIQGKFYPLQHDEWLRAVKLLSPSEKDVLYYIRTIDPYGNGIELSAAAIARDLSTEARKVCRQTVSRALKRLDKLGFIDLELITVRVAVKPKGIWSEQESGVENSLEDYQQAGFIETPLVCGDTIGVSTHHTSSPHTDGDRHTPQGAVTHQAKAEDQPDSEFQNSKTNKTYSDQKDTTSAGILKKFEDKLKLYGLYLKIWRDEELIDNPRLAPILKALAKIPRSVAESSIQAFLTWIRNAKNVEDKYKALEVALVRRWAV